LEFGPILTWERGATQIHSCKEQLANPQLHRHLEAYLPLKLTGAQWLSQPIWKQEYAIGMCQGWAEEPETTGGSTVEVPKLF
jgi:hypothetical protein